MLRALVRDLALIPGVEVVAMRDSRLTLDLPAVTHVSESAREFWPAFRRVMLESDAVWPIAPEQDRILERLSVAVLESGQRLLGSRTDAVRVTASKLRTAQALQAAGVKAVPTFADERSMPDDVQEAVVKPDDGAGCQETYLFQARADLRRWLRDHPARGRIFQPFVRGTPLSLSVLACDGRARLLACNRQHVQIDEGRFEFHGVSVNAVRDIDGRYARLARSVVRALPGLWGYVGIDLIDTREFPVVVEINPRLTTSYAGLHRALGINPAGLVLELPGSLDDVGMARSSRVVDVEVAHAG